MKLISTISFLFLAIAPAISQDTTATESKSWKLMSLFGLNGTQSSFVNWNAGGRNNVSVLAFINASAHFTKNKIKWDNDLGLALGGLQYIGAGSGDATLQKTDDRIEFSSKIGYKMKESLYLSFISSFKSQFIDGFASPDDSMRSSTFLAPGYINLSLGLDYRPNDHFTLFLSPVAGKITIVNDEVLANSGAFGVEGATYDPMTGAVLSPGQRARYEFGAYLKIGYKKEIFKNVTMTATGDLFSNYLDRPENIDVNADLLFNMKVNSWLSASVNWTLMYDHDINIRDMQGNIGPRTQFKSVIGIGITYKIKNFEEE